MQFVADYNNFEFSVNSYRFVGYNFTIVIKTSYDEKTICITANEFHIFRPSECAKEFAPKP